MGPKKRHGTAGGGPKNPLSNVADSDHIVFTSDRTKSAKNITEKDRQPSPPRPDARKVIGGASWTGKLPVNLLSELCQKQKWNKPEYSMRKLPDAAGGGHVSNVTLSTTNPKSKEITKLAPFQLPPANRDLASQDTPLEARHFAATYALFRVGSMKNIHMTLPPKYRDLWKGEFAELKNADIKAGRGWMYDADPFAAALETKKIHDAIEVRKAKAAETRNSPSPAIVLPGQKGGRSLSKGWERVPRVEMGNKIRSDVEEVVKIHGKWNPYRIEQPKTQQSAILTEVSQLGFRLSHVQEALHLCKDRQETLEWLLIHVPEDDLPPWAFPESYTAGISLASGDLAKDSKIKRLALAGYSSDDCAAALRRSDGDERAAANELQKGLIDPSANNNTLESAQSSDLWQEELDALHAIFGERFSSRTHQDCTIEGESDAASMSFQFQRPLGDYPCACPPILAIHSKDVPAYIRLSALRRALAFAVETCLGGPMIFSIVEWLETNLPAILKDPGPLQAISHFTPARDTHLTNEKARKAQKAINTGKGRARRSRIADSRVDIDLKSALSNRGSTANQQKMVQMRQNLPAWRMKEDIVQAVNGHQCVIISGDTGSGKSTQSVQFILDDMICKLKGSITNIVCTQPRRISAMGLADRISDERCSSVGDEVGYAIRGDSKLGPDTRITFMTTGVLLRRMQSCGDLVESVADISHIFVDEVHERSVDTDLLLALLKDILKLRSDLKLVLMSATLDSDHFASYFGGPDQVGQVYIPGRTHPVTDHYIDDILKFTNSGSLDSAGLDGDAADMRSGMDELTLGRSIRDLGMGINYNLLADLVFRIDRELGSESGAILIFLPGTLEIDRCLRAIQSLPRILAFPLHASLTPAEQRKVFPSPPKGVRKVIASTNVAETSITIADVVAVIDTGRVKETRYDAANGIVRLEEVWASRASCKQRKGRAGRVQAGKCYKMFTLKVESEMAPAPAPEIRRLPLEQLCLSVKATAPDRDVARFLQQTLTPPEDQAVDVAMRLLHRMGALDNNELTALGKHISMIPADLRCAKLLVYGVVFGCLEACLTVAAIVTARNPFVSPRDKRDEAKLARSTFSAEDGDLLLAMSAFNDWSDRSQTANSREMRSWCTEKFLSAQTLREISSTKWQLLSSLKDASIIPVDYNRSEEVYQTLNRDTNNSMLLRALVAGALNPQIARIDFPDKKYFASISGAVEMDPEAKTIKYFTQDNGRVFIHPSSSLFDSQTLSGSASYLSYFSMMATSKTFIRDLTRKFR